MLDKCYCGPVGKYSGHRLYELFAARGPPGSKSALEQGSAQTCSHLLSCSPKLPVAFPPLCIETTHPSVLILGYFMYKQLD